MWGIVSPFFTTYSTEVVRSSGTEEKDSIT
jgi:hypothetical protein